MGHEELVNEAKYWTIEPSDYKSDQELLKAIESKREMNGASHGVTQQDVDSGMASQKDVVQEGAVESVPKARDPNIKDTKHEATISRPTPGDAETKKQQVKTAMDKKTNAPDS